MNQEAERLQRELDLVDAALDECNASQSSDRAQRIRDSFLHNRLIVDAVFFDAEKVEQSSRAQCVLWMGLARDVALRALGEDPTS